MVSSKGDLLEDVVIEILSQLPVKSLMRFRCVCKDWHALLESPTLISKHLINKNHNTHLVVNYMNASALDGEPLYVLSLFLDETLTDLSCTEDLYKHIPILGQIMGPYDGLFCICDNNDRIALWNPATQEFRTLPKCKTVLPNNISIYFCNVGFEYDPVTNDYKLVLIRTLWDDNGQFFFKFSHVALYTLSTNYWTDLGGNGLICYNLRHQFDSVYLKGICYWLALRDDRQSVILSFLMGDKMFKEIPEPSIQKSGPQILGVYNGYLSLLLLDKIESCFDIWVMREMLWTKQTTVGPLLGINEPLRFWKNGTFFVKSNTGRLLLYDPSTQELKDFGIKTLGMEIHVYKESLIRISQKDNFFDIPWNVLGVY